MKGRRSTLTDSSGCLLARASIIAKPPMLSSAVEMTPPCRRPDTGWPTSSFRMTNLSVAGSELTSSNPSVW